MKPKININRLLDLKSSLSQRSCFLFGPRQTGKSWLIRNQLPDCKLYNLLDSSTYAKLSHSPERIRQELQENDEIVIIDEIQKAPSLLDEVQLMIEEYGISFLLTGSSARKLRRGGVNLLGGRARTLYLHPFTSGELGVHFDLIRAMDIGLIPSIYLSNDPVADLDAYIGTYLQEEIAAEAIVRNIPAFSRFLTVAALSHGQIINYLNIASDAQVARTTVQEYFEILKDTLIGYELPAWKHTIKRKAFSTSKFYFFDCGIVRFLQKRRNLQLGSTECGEAFESFIFHEIKSFIDYKAKGTDLHYWRSLSQFEVDFIIGDTTAVEVKAKTNIANHDLKGLRALKEEQLLRRYIIVSMEEISRTVDGIEILPWKTFIEFLWNGDFV